MWQGRLRQSSEFVYEIPDDHKEGMRVPGTVFTSERLLDSLLHDDACEQVANVATLPGITGRSMAMPDAHWGYGFPIGGVAATLIDEGGVISPGGVGFDINCGVRLLSTDLTEDDLRGKIGALTDAIFRNVPSGVGSKARIKVTPKELDDILERGAAWAVEEGYGSEEDLFHLEENGQMKDARPEYVSLKAKTRGLPQVGSLGAGNHFIEIQRVDSILDDEAAKTMGVNSTGQIAVMIHTGSRGLGYQVCQDQVSDLGSSFSRDGGSFHSEKYGFSIPDRQLVAAPFESNEAEAYLGAMRSAANYAWANRQLITHWIRQSFSSVLSRGDDELGIGVVYDIAHNIAKVEEHEIEGKRSKVCVHRKGATRSFGPGSEGIPPDYSDIGQPVIIPGDMGTASYLMVGTRNAMSVSFGSTCHGAGRVLSRTKAVQSFSSNSIVRTLGERGILVKAASPKVVAEEAPDAYKDIEEVVRVAEGADLSRRVARFTPIAVIKG
ncbi:MAG: RtcB family protein [Candidatus Thermoplasmatota archaeon]|nr:RtcB family protein [Candidatus Thermoplasmatota archaeon]